MKPDTLDADRAAPREAAPLPAATPRRRGPSRHTIIAAGSAAALALAGTGWILLAPSQESTDAAYVEADSINVAPKIQGLVAAVLVHHNQRVHAGDALIRIDSEEYQARVLRAEAALQDAEATLAAARADLARLAPEERLAASNVRLAQTAIRAADAESGHAASDRRRFESLEASGAVAARDVDSYRTGAVTAEQNAARSRARLDVARDNAAVTQARRPALEAAVARAQAQVAAARAELDLARQDLRHTVIRAPVDGIVANRKAEIGDYVRAGSQLMTLVPADALYVTANFKETQTGRMLAGQKARIHVDALPGARITGTVESLAPGSGSTFALLPFEPGTGNFTKIVQRVPVRIRFDPGQAAVARLRPGLSVTATVRLGD